MTDPRLDLDRRPVRPVGNLFRVTAAASVLTLPLFWGLRVVLPNSVEVNCVVQPCPPSVDSMGMSVSSAAVLVITAAVELVVIAAYLARAAARRTLDLRTGLRWSPAAVAAVALATGGFSWLLNESQVDLGDLGSTGFGYLLLLALWLLTPLVLYVVDRGDRRAVLPVSIGLAPTAVAGLFALEDSPIAALPTAMLIIALTTVLLLRRRQHAVVVS
ncbi:hypothetical protein [Kribbella sindirgiensis]|uniref:DUF998 domain-containing protein n=1 Tax=Kribbella sindirgiensis TaxID=1124744 RepID=A0A4R0ILC1_9ACTN|nr:hypothetical protein [Kribbella sindirgiensis]TCC33619.1 hypothetical protein E0H50_16810 [Kribbella sindirgiensis]